jgi:hypothetical protein
MRTIICFDTAALSQTVERVRLHDRGTAAHPARARPDHASICEYIVLRPHQGSYWPMAEETGVGNDRRRSNWNGISPMHGLARKAAID